MSTHSILQTIEILKIINGMEFFSAHERLSMIWELGQALLSEDISTPCTIKVLGVQSEKDWTKLSPEQQGILLRLGTHPLISTEMTNLLYKKTNTEMAPIDQHAVERMQEEITKEAENEYLKWFEEQEELEESLLVEEEDEEEEDDDEEDLWGEGADWEEEEEEQTEEFEFPPPPITDDNWEIAFVVYQPLENSFHIRFLRANKTQVIPCTQSPHVPHPDPHILQATIQSLFPHSGYTNDFSSFHTPLFNDENFLKKYNKKKKKLFVLQLRQFASQPMKSTFSISGNRCALRFENNQMWDGLSIHHTQKMSVQWPFHANTFPDIGAYIRKKGQQYEFQAKGQLSMGWQLSWIAPHALPIYIEQEIHNMEQSTSGTHSNSIVLEARSHTDNQEAPFSHHKMPFSGFMQTRKDAEIIDFSEAAHSYTVKNTPKLGKTSPMNVHKQSKKRYTEGTSNHVLSECRSVCQMTEINTPFSMSSVQQCTSAPTIHIPLTESATILLQSTGNAGFTLHFQNQSWHYHMQCTEEVREHEKTFFVEDNKQQGWKNALIQDASQETLTQKITETMSSFGWVPKDEA